MEVNLKKLKLLSKKHHWWLKHANKTFILPHKRSDSVVQLASERVRPGRKTKCTILDGFVYNLNSCNNVYTIPEVIDLDYNFGYFDWCLCSGRMYYKTSNIYC